MNDSARKIIVIFSLVILLLLVSLVLLLPLGTGYKVTVSGVTSYSGTWPYYTWSVTFSNAVNEEDKYLLQASPLFQYPWLSKPLIVEVYLEDYRIEKKIGQVDVWQGGTEPWSVTLRHVEPGFYTGTINVYEVVGSFLGFGGEKVLKTTGYFTHHVQ